MVEQKASLVMNLNYAFSDKRLYEEKQEIQDTADVRLRRSTTPKENKILKITSNHLNLRYSMQGKEPKNEHLQLNNISILYVYGLQSSTKQWKHSCKIWEASLFIIKVVQAKSARSANVGIKC